MKSEVGIRWLTEKKPDYVRQEFVDLEGPKGLSEADEARFNALGRQIYGYADLDDTASADFIGDRGEKRFRRRIFYRSEQCDDYQDGVCPNEAAAPGSIEPGVWGVSPYKKLQVTVRVSQDLLWKLNARTQRAGLSQTEAVVEAIEDYLKRPIPSSSEDRIWDLENRMAQVERTLGALQR